MVFTLHAPARAEEPAAPAAADPAEQPYVYNGVSRDPFLPLAGGAAMDLGPSAADKEPGAFNAGNLELKIIVRAGTGRWATLVSNSGDRYLVQNGKIYDARKKIVEGHVGIIKEKTLVIIGPNNQVTELKMKKDQEEEKEKTR